MSNVKLMMKNMVSRISNLVVKVLLRRNQACKLHRSSKPYTTLPPEVSSMVQRGSIDPRSRRVVVTGGGIISPLGHCVHDVFDQLLQGNSGVGSIKSDIFEYQKLGIHYAAQIQRESLEYCDSICQKDERLKSNAMTYAEFAALQALKDAKLPSDLNGLRTGVCIGNSMVDLDFVADAHRLVTSGKGKRVTPYFVPRVLGNMAAALIAIQHGFRGPNHTASTACSTGLHAIGDAYNFIRNNAAEVMVAGGTDACITPLSMTGFSRARALSTKFKDSPEKASRPFDVDRDGFVMAEGAAVVILEELEHAKRRSAPIYCEVVGYGASCDADHITAGLSDGSGALLAILNAMGNVIALPNMTDQIWLVNAHATSTPRGDAAELHALNKFLHLLKTDLKEWNVKVGEEEEEVGPIVTANKSNLGHMISASGSAETAMTCLSLQTGKVPGILNLHSTTEIGGEGVSLRLLKNSVATGSSAPTCRRLAIKNSFGFGGTNATLILAEYKE